MPSPLELAILITAIDSASAPLRKVQEQMQQIKRTGLEMAALGIGMLAPVKSVINAAAEAQQHEMNLQRLLPTGIAGREAMAQAEKFASDMTENHVGSMADLNDTLAQNYALTNNMTDAIARTRQVEALAAATNISMAEANKVLRESVSLFGDKTK